MKEDSQFFKGVAATVIASCLILVASVLVVRVLEGKWAADRFTRPIGDITIIRTDRQQPLYICADTINGEYKNCLSAPEIAEAARAKWRK